MKLSRAKALTSIIFIAFCLLFSYQFLIFAQQPTTNIPAELQTLLQGKSSDFSSAASQLKETDLPSALAVIELLKFKALHQEIPASVDQINDFESQIKSKLAKSSVVSFSKTDTCCKKIEAKEIEIAGQKLVIPEYYIAEVSLAITGVIPTGEAGTIFPDIQVNLFSQSNIAEYSLVIDGKAVQQNKIGTFKDGDELGLIFRPDLNSDSVLAIGTHTAEITISNEKGEIVNRKWSFTVGVYDVSTPALPEDATLVNEFPVLLAALFKNPGISGELTVLVYQDKTGKRHTEYRLVSSSGMITTTRNLAHISRKVLLKRSGTLEVAPGLHYTFAGSRIEFSYSWSGDGSIVETGWEVITGPEKHTTPSITVAGDTCATCKLVIEHIFTDGAGNEEVFYETLTNSQSVKCITTSTAIRSNRLSFLSNESSHSFKLDGKVSCNVASDLKEGQQRQIVFDEPGSPTGTLKVNRLRWVLHASEGEPVISTPTATQTALVFSKHGYAEACFEIELSWVEAGYTFTSTYKPDDSGLYAFFPVDGKLVFSKFPEGQITIGRRKIELKSFEFKIRNQTRVVEGPSDFDLSEPILLCESSLWPSSSPICINKAVPLIREAQAGSLLENENNFSFTTPMAIEPGVINLSLHGRFSQTAVKNSEQDCYISNLQAIPVYSETDLINVKLEPDELITFYEGQELKFKTALVPVAGFGTGEYSADQETLDILAGYNIPQSPTIYWYEEPLWEEDEGEWRKKARQTQDFYHLFDPTAGVGSYSMNCGFMFELVEKDTQESISIYIENSTPVDVLPGLRFLSPIEELAYPKNASIKVKTTLDAKEYQKLWDKIKWKLNDKDFTPDTDTPPFNIFLDHTGKWKLEAILTIKESEIQGGIIAKDSDEPIILKDTAEFEVKDIELSITPNRKLVEFTSGKQIEVKLEAKVGDNEISQPETPVPWQDDEMQISIDPIDWSLVTAPKDCASLLSDSQGFTNICEFAGNGAATVLATVTARIIGAEKIFRKKHKAFKRDVYEEPVFTFPLKRADVWAIKQKISNYSGKFPTRAISETNRFFGLTNATIALNSAEFTWPVTKDSTIKSKELQLAPAVPGVPSLSPIKLIVEWYAPVDQSSSGLTFKPKFFSNETTDITLKAIVDFGSDGILSPLEIKHKVNVFLLSDIIDIAVVANPVSITINQPSAVNLFFGLKNGALNNQSSLLIWAGEYKIDLHKVAWLVGSGGLPGVEISPTDPVFTFVRDHPGDFKVYAKPIFEVQAVDEDAKAGTIQLLAGPENIFVSADIKKWSLDPNREDHLENLFYLIPDDIKPRWRYQAGHHVWLNVGIKPSYPFVIGCDSFVHLIPEFSAVNRNITELNYQWLNIDNEPIGNEGVVNCAEGADIPTPDKIGKYHLRLEVAGVNEIALLTEIYVVQAINSKTSKENFFINCVQDSVEALKGFDKNTDSKALVDKFYQWWWHSDNEESGNHLKYGIETKNLNEVIALGGSMCGGLGNYFYKSLKCQGFAGLDRIGFNLLTKNYPVPDSDNKSFDPVTTEYWGAVIYTDPGLNQKTMPEVLYTIWPTTINISSGTYQLSYANRYTGVVKIPPVDIQKVVIDRQKNIEVNTTDRFYMFFAPNDGHALVFYTDSSSQTWLYDPSFGKGKFGSIQVDFPDLEKETTIKRLGIDVDNELWRYLGNSISYLRGFTYYKDKDLYKGISVFDIPFDRSNYLKVQFETYKDWSIPGGVN